MKKIMMVVVSVMMCLAGMCGWDVTHYEGDALRGYKPSKSFSWNDGEFELICHARPSDKRCSVQIICKCGFFNWNSDEQAESIVGFYKNGKLESRVKWNIRVSSESPRYGHVFGNLATQIMDSLCDTNVSIRIIADRYDKTDFDITVKGDLVFQSIDWLPSNVERIKKAKKVAREEEEKKAAIAKAIAREQKIQMEKKAKETRLSELEGKYYALKEKYLMCKEKGYKFVAQKTKNEMMPMITEIKKLRAELGR